MYLAGAPVNPARETGNAVGFQASSMTMTLPGGGKHLKFQASSYAQSRESGSPWRCCLVDVGVDGYVRFERL